MGQLFLSIRTCQLAVLLLLFAVVRVPSFEIIRDEILYQNWRILTRRVVQLPVSKMHVDFEIVSQKGTDEAVLIFVWNTTSQTATLIREYMPSLHQHQVGLAAGMVDHDKHSDTLCAAQHELEEECRLKGGTWYELCQPTTMDKYSTTRLTSFLCIDPEPVPEHEAKPRDVQEEGMDILSNVSLDQLRSYLRNSNMTVVGSWATQLALQKLADISLI